MFIEPGPSDFAAQFELGSGPWRPNVGVNGPAGLFLGGESFPPKPCLKRTRARAAELGAQDSSGSYSTPSPHALHGSRDMSNLGEAWQPVRKRFWWRSERRSRSPSVSSQSSSDSNKAWVKEVFRGKCCVCLAPDHRAAQCRDPVRCLNCKRWGHRARECRQSRSRGPSKSESPPSSNPIGSQSSPPHKHILSGAQQSSPSSSSPAMDRLLASASRRFSSSRRRSSAAHSIRTEPLRYPVGDNRIRPRVAFKAIPTSAAMVRRRDTLLYHALIITEEGRCRAESKEEVADFIASSFGIRPFEFQVFQHRPEPYMVIFTHQRDKEMVESRQSISWGNLALRFHPWRVERYADRSPMPFFVKLSLEGVPLHAWNEEVAARIICDECVLHSVDEATRRRTDVRFFVLNAWAKDPFMIPQIVYLTVADPERGGQSGVEVSLTRPSEIKRGFVYTVLIHLDSAEDLLYFHYPADQLDAEGHQRFREFIWVPGRPDGADENGFPLFPDQGCRRPDNTRGRDREDDDDVGGGRRQRPRDVFQRIGRWGSSREKGQEGELSRGRSSVWCRGESSAGRRRQRSASPTAMAWANSEEKRELNKLWQEKGDANGAVKQEYAQGKRRQVQWFDLEPAHNVQQQDVTAQLQQGALVVENDQWSMEAQCSSKVPIPDAADTESTGVTPSDAILIDTYSFVYDNDSEGSVDFRIEEERSSCAVEVPIQQGIFSEKVVMSQHLFRELANNKLAEEMPRGGQQSEALDKLKLDYEEEEQVPEVLDADWGEEGEHNMDLVDTETAQSANKKLESFLNNITAKTDAGILNPPRTDEEGHGIAGSEEQGSARRSDRIKNANRGDKPAVQLAQEVLAKKMGVIPEDQPFDEAACREYLRTYDKPLTDDAVKIVRKLIELGEEKGAKKKAHKTKAKKKMA